MMKESPFKAFIALTVLDEKIRILRQKIARRILQAKELQSEIANQELRLLQAKEATISAHKVVDAQELVLKELDESERKRRKQLDTVSGYRDYQSVQQELVALQEKQQKQEEHVLHAWKAFESAQALEKTAQQLCQEKIDEFASQLKARVSEIEQLENEVSVIEQLRPAREQVVPDEWLMRYERMRGQVEDPVVPILNKSCGGCFGTLTSQDMIQAGRGGLIECKRCYRLLYLESAIDSQSAGE